MRNQAAIPPKVGANKNGIVESQTSRSHRQKFHRNGCGPKHRMRRNWNCFDTKQANPLRISNTDCSRVSQLSSGEGHSAAQGALPLFSYPLRGQRQELFQVFDGCLPIHAALKSKNPAAAGQKDRRDFDNNCGRETSCLLDPGVKQQDIRDEKAATK